VADKRVLDLLPPEMLSDTIMFPAAESLTPLEFGAAATLTNPLRAEIMARFKSAERPMTTPARHGLDGGEEVKGSRAARHRLLLAPAGSGSCFCCCCHGRGHHLFFGVRAATGGYQAPSLSRITSTCRRASRPSNTLTLAPVGTLICLLIGYPLAYFLALKASARSRLFLMILVIVPFWTSFF